MSQRRALMCCVISRRPPKSRASTHQIMMSVCVRVRACVRACVVLRLSTGWLVICRAWRVV
jgi:hypothetical protein